MLKCALQVLSVLFYLSEKKCVFIAFHLYHQANEEAYAVYDTDKILHRGI